MPAEDDYFYRRNAEIQKRLLNGEKPSKIAADYSMENSDVEAMFPLCNYRMFCVAVKRRFAMGETSYEISLLTKQKHELILSVLNLSFQEEALIFTVMRMHDNGFSTSRISRVTRLSAESVKDVLLKVGRDTSAMPYYCAIGGIKTSVDDPNWYEDICKEVVEREYPNYMMSLENNIEQKYRDKARETYQKIALEEMDEDPVDESDEEFADNLIAKLSRRKGVTKRKVIAKAIIYYAKRVGVVKDGGGLGGKAVSRVKRLMEREIDEFYLSMGEISQQKVEDTRKSYLSDYDKKKSAKEMYDFLPDYLKD